VGDIDINGLIEFHKQHGKLATVTAVRPPGRFGTMSLDGDTVNKFQEKQVGPGSYINGGYFVLSPDVLGYIDDDEAPWEDKPLTSLSAEGNLMAFRHEGYWQPMDTIREREFLEDHWESGQAPWKVW
jgi:glucose-1-phosphate cytidylyltransferase